MKFKLKFTISDIFIISLSFLLIMLLIFSNILFKPASNEGDIVVVRYNNEIVKTMPLNEDNVFLMHKKDYPDLYGDVLEITIKDQKVSITKEDSPFHYCSKLGEIKNRGSELICAPNCVRVSIQKGKENQVTTPNSDYDFRPN